MHGYVLSTLLGKVSLYWAGVLHWASHDQEQSSWSVRRVAPAWSKRLPDLERCVWGNRVLAADWELDDSLHVSISMCFPSDENLLISALHGSLVRSAVAGCVNKNSKKERRPSSLNLVTFIYSLSSSSIIQSLPSSTPTAAAIG